MCLSLSTTAYSDTGYLSNLLAAGIYDASYGHLAGGKVYVYEAGTTTTDDLYTDVDMTTAADVPIVLDGDGRVKVYGNGSYKLVITNKYGQSVVTIDNYELKSVLDFITDNIDPFGATLYQSTIVASSTTTDTLTSGIINATTLTVNASTTLNGDTIMASVTISSLSATLSSTLDADDNFINNVATPTLNTHAVNKGYLTATGIASESMSLYTTAGAATFTCPLGITKVYVTLVGAGGGGGGWGNAGNFAGEAGFPGQAFRTEYATTPETDYAISIGSGGAAGSDTGSGGAGSDGTIGNDTTFGTLTAKGGRGGMAAGIAADCIDGVKNSMSFPKPALGGYPYYTSYHTSNQYIRGCGGMGGNIATYTNLEVLSYSAGPGLSGMVVVEW